MLTDDSNDKDYNGKKSDRTLLFCSHVEGRKDTIRCTCVYIQLFTYHGRYFIWIWSRTVDDVFGSEGLHLHLLQGHELGGGGVRIEDFGYICINIDINVLVNACMSSRTSIYRCTGVIHIYKLYLFIGIYKYLSFFEYINTCTPFYLYMQIHKCKYLYLYLSSYSSLCTRPSDPHLIHSDLTYWVA
jgi:hypothetical protein